MFYLSKICRVCLKNSGHLLDLDGEDYDLVKLSDKLKFCTKMVIHKEDLSTSICKSCIKKLRITYLFQKMCSCSETILQNYVNELLSCSDDKHFVNSELTVTITPCIMFNEAKPKVTVTSIDKLRHMKFRNNCGGSQKAKRKRVSKGQRCSLLKKLLANYNHNNNNVNKGVYKRVRRRTRIPLRSEKFKGGLRDLLGFIKNYDFGYQIQEPLVCREETALERLEEFSKSFFYTDFTKYHETISSVIQDSESSDADEMFNEYNEEEDLKLWSSNSEMKIKEEIVKIKAEKEEEEEEIIPFEYVQACYDNDHLGNSSTQPLKTEKDPIKLKKSKNGERNMNNNSQLDNEVSNLELLEQFTVSKGKNVPNARTMSPFSLKCRTRGQPFINPKLMEQFKRRSFKCDTCNRSFKSPGYLHSHCTKMRH